MPHFAIDMASSRHGSGYRQKGCAPTSAPLGTLGAVSTLERRLPLPYLAFGFFFETAVIFQSPLFNFVMSYFFLASIFALYEAMA